LHDFGSALGRYSWASGVVLVDLADQVGRVFISDSQGLTVHPSFLVHSNRSLRLFGVNEALLSLAEISPFKLKFGLV
jgi:hypothetical protein